jgi:hypothetical protein
MITAPKIPPAIPTPTSQTALAAPTVNQTNGVPAIPTTDNYTPTAVTNPVKTLALPGDQEMLDDILKNMFYSPIAALAGGIIGSLTRGRIGGMWGSIIGASAMGVGLGVKYLWAIAEASREKQKTSGYTIILASVLSIPATVGIASAVTAAVGAGPVAIALGAIVTAAAPAILVGRYFQWDLYFPFLKKKTNQPPTP